MERPKGKNRIIVALDVPNLSQAGDLVGALAQHVGMFKTGLQLIMSVGAPQIVNWFKEQGYGPDKIFLDGKLNDIPNTIGEAAKAIANLGVRMFNVHACSGIDGMRAAVDKNLKVNLSGDGGKVSVVKGSLVLAVTVLTSFEENDGNLTFGGPTKAKVLEFSRRAKLAGCDGIICSPQELTLLRTRPELKDMLLVTPGVRPEWAAAGDQKRIMTPGEAVKAGADYLVIGRPIIKPPEEIGGPVEAAKKIAAEIELAEQEMEKEEE